MSKARLAVLSIALAAIFGFGILMGLILPRLAGIGGGPRTYNTSIILQQVQTLSQLITVKYVMEKVEILEDPSQNTFRQLLPLPDNTRVILIAHGIVKAGIDLSRIKSEDIQISGKTVKLSLPPPQITDAYLDERQTQVLEHNTGFWREFNKDLEQTARQNAVDDIRRAARNSGILKDADERARAQLKNLFSQLGFELEIRSK